MPRFILAWNFLQVGGGFRSAVTFCVGRYGIGTRNDSPQSGTNFHVLVRLRPV